ncbi:MAG: chorismate synthase [Lachnospiraceae bacterium]|jgi:chorismate synthase|nr:chorismate synthase [Lachnospiraceae bacterium]
MAGSTIGTLFAVTTWGESHGTATGVVIDGCPAGLSLTEADIMPYLRWRRPGQSDIVTPRDEDDEVTILSGVFQGQTTGTPISLLIENKSANSEEYTEDGDFFRPGHADYSYQAKYGWRDYRGGGRASGRETVARVAAGAIAAKVLLAAGVEVLAFTRGIGAVVTKTSDFSRDDVYSRKTRMPCNEADREAELLIKECIAKGDSVGGVIECRIKGVPPGWGEPVFQKLDARLAQAMMSIGAVKAVEIGDGMGCGNKFGSNYNDGYLRINKNGIAEKLSNHGGGISGGISDGSDIILRVHIKPTPSIAAPQETIDRLGQQKTIALKGRHDPCIVPRAVVVVEMMAALVLVDMMLMGLGSRIENIARIHTHLSNP